MLTQNCGGAQECNFVFSSVPQGHRLVVHHVSGRLTANAPTTSIVVQAGPGLFTNSTQFTLVPDGGTREANFDQLVLFYAEAGQTPAAQASTAGAIAFQSNTQLISLAGYLVDCTAAPCAAIAH